MQNQTERIKDKAFFSRYKLQVENT